MHQNSISAGALPNSTGEIAAFSRPLAGFKGPTTAKRVGCKRGNEARERRREEGEGKERRK